MSLSPKQGEIWLVDLNPTIGQEINKIRTALVVSDDIVGKLQTKTIAPITSWKDNFYQIPWMSRLAKDSLNNLTKDSCVDSYQIRNISKLRFIKKLGEIDNKKLYEVHQKIVKTLNIGYKI